MNEDLLLKYLKHQCSDKELQQIDQWMKQNPDHARQLFGMEEVWSLRDELRFSDPKLVEQAYSRLRERIDRPAPKVERMQSMPLSGRESKPIRRRFIGRIIGYAAAAVIVLSVGLNLYQMQLNRGGNNNIVEVPAGQSISLTLSDGTKVWLNAESKLIYPAHFSRKARRVTLQGEGYFEVAHNEKAPFTVYTKDLNIRVLGTRFNARAYPDELQTMVTLSQGRVRVSRPDGSASMELNPDECAVYMRSGGLHKEAVTSARESHSWTSGELVFSDMPLCEIVRTVERHFDVKITIKTPELATERFTCHTQPQTSLLEVLNLLRSTQNLDYEMTDREVFLYKP